MNKIHQFLPLHFAVFLTIGIVIGNFVVIPILLSLTTMLLLLLICIILLNKVNSASKIGFQISVYFFFLFLGWQLILFQQPINQSHHFSHFSTSGKVANVQIVEKMKSTEYQDKYLIKVLRIDQRATNGKAILMVTKNPISQKYAIGQILLIPAVFEKITKPLNPYTFDYAKYMNHQGVYFQIESNSNFIKSVSYKVDQLPLIGLKLRDFIQKKMQNPIFGKNEWAVINALVLGDRQFVSKDLQGDYTAAGVVHILAVSGLHIGILYMILSFLFSPLLRLKNGKITVGISILLLLWIFALIAGLSGSVVRAVTMFSFITLGSFLRNQKSHILESIFASYFVILLFKPLFVFDVGFQLSYLAVIGIVVLQPKLMDFFPKNIHPVPLRMAQLFTVSVAATIATIPLSLYYFHQFPMLFWLSNIVIIPFIGIILGMGLLVALLSILNIMPNFIIHFYNEMLSILNHFVNWVAEKEAFLLKDISFSIWDTLTSYVVIFLFFRWIFSIKKPPVLNLKFQTFLLSVIAIQMVFISEKYIQTQSQELVIFHKNKATIIGIKNQKKWEIYHSIDSLHIKNYPFLSSYQLAYNLDNISIINLRKNVFWTSKGNLLRIDSLGIYQNLDFKPDLVLLTESPKINLDRLIQELNPKTIIADGSNNPYLIKKWKKTCKSKKNSFYTTKEKGAYIIK